MGCLSLAAAHSAVCTGCRRDALRHSRRRHVRYYSARFYPASGRQSQAVSHGGACAAPAAEPLRRRRRRSPAFVLRDARSYPVRVLHAAQTARAVRRMCASDAAAACLSGRGALVHGLRLNLHAAGLARLFRTRVFAFSACKSSGGRTHGCLLRLWLSAVRRFGVLPGSPAGFRRSAAADAALSAGPC